MTLCPTETTTDVSTGISTEITAPPSASPPAVSSVRGIDHVGLTVPDLDEATRFFTQALGASVLYDALPRSAGPRYGSELEARLGVPPGTVQVAIRLLSLPDGPSLELFEYRGSDQQAAVGPSDYGWQHVAFYVDDMEAIAAAIERAGGLTLGSPRPLPNLEAGPGNRFLYCRTPWGSTLELISYPDPQPYEQHTGARRWRPGQDWLWEELTR
jgi:catechol 2,3-dioxygenase-like lactoylglutathione lyase family enzyme